jgi:hypothetical protein
MNYKVVHEDDRAFHVEHPDGRRFQVAKKGLSASTLKKISGMKPQHLDEGGDIKIPEVDVPDSLKKKDSDRSQKQIDDDILNAANDQVYGGSLPYVGDKASKPADPYAGQPSMMTSAPLAAPPQEALPSAAGEPPQPQMAPGQGSQMPGMPVGPQSDPFGAAMAANTRIGQATATGQQAIAKANDDYIESLKAVQQRKNDVIADHDHRVEQLNQAYMDNKIDPNRLWNEKSTGGKIGSAIALILGGIAGRGNGNVALTMLNKQVDDDILSQKTELGKKDSLLANEYKEHGNMLAALSSSKSLLLGSLQAQVAKQAAMTGSQTAIEQAKVLNAQLEAQRQALKQQMAAQSLKGMGTYGGLPEGGELDRYLLMSDPKYKEGRVKVGNAVYQAPGKDEAQSLRIVESKAGPILDALKELDSLGPQAAVPGTAAYNRGKALRANLSTNIAGLESAKIGSKRINETEAHRAIEGISNPTSFAQLMQRGVRTNSFLKDLENEIESNREANLSGYKRFGGAKPTDGWK